MQRRVGDRMAHPLQNARAITIVKRSVTVSLQPSIPGVVKVRAIFHDLQFRARRLSGTASIFEAADIAAAAHALEQAAAAAAHSHSSNANPRVWGAMLTLMSLLQLVEAE
jgi:hypothetical protein